MSTYTPIATQTLGSAAASVTFSSIPQGYTDLVLVIAGINSSGGSDACVLQLGNNSIDTAASYSTTYLYGVGSGSGSSGRQSSANFIQPARSNSANQTSSVLQIQNYSNSTTYKTVLSRSSDASAFVWSSIGLWRSITAINTLKVYNDGGGNFASGSTFSIYGIAAGAVGAKATGGIVISDASYVYHTFLNSGTFMPYQNLTCDYLVVAGGGGGGAGVGGGGGAGGYRTSIGGSPLSLTAQGYAVTVGAGGTGGVQGSSAGNNGNNSTISSITSTGGGGGGTETGSFAPGSGGSGGGGAGAPGSNRTGGTASPSGQGNAGGDGGGGSIAYGGGGGGGAGATGTAGSGTVGGNGGTGLANSITGSSVTYAGGGGAGIYVNNGTVGSGGTGGGGAGGADGATGSNGTANTGGGAGGGGTNVSGSARGNGGIGGSGIVIIRYAI